MSLLVVKAQNFSSKQKGRNELKFRMTNKGSCLQTEGGGGGEEGEENLRWWGEE